MRGARSSLFMIVVILVAVGIVMIYSASAIYADSAMKDSLYFLKRHMIYVTLGFAMMILAMFADLSKFEADPDINKFRDIFTVDTLVRYVMTKVN